MLNGIQPVIFGDGLITRDFFYVKDTAVALSNLLTMNNLQNELINIGTGEEITMKTLLNQLVDTFGDKTIKIKHLDARPADVPRLWVKADKFKSLTGFEAKYSFAEGLKETIDYFTDLNKTRKLIDEVNIINW